MVVLQLLGTSFSCYNNNCINKLWYPSISFYIYIWFYWHFLHFLRIILRKVFNFIFIIINPYEHFKLIDSNHQLNPFKSFRTHFLWTLLYPITPLLQVLYQFSSISIYYPNLGFNSSSLKFLVSLSSNCRPPSNHAVLCKYEPSPFLTNCSNVYGVFGVLAILGHTHSWFSIQYN